MECNPQLDGIVGRSQPMRAMVELILKLAPNDYTILIQGESGSGKEIIARSIHRHSKRLKGPFLPVNCGAIPESLIEAQLFGHQKGAFTGAASDKAGLFEAANGGTVFLDEIGEMPLAMQVKLLRVLQEKEVVRVGGTKPIKIDVRVIAATNRDLKAMIKNGGFREDLYYRISALEIKVPALRERREDIPLLALHFVEKFRKEVGDTLISFEPDALEALQAYEWPGNVRELENMVNRFLVVADNPVITAENVSALLPATKNEIRCDQQECLPYGRGGLVLSMSILELAERETLDAYLKRVKNVAVQTAIAHFQDKALAAERLGLASDTLRKHVQRHRRRGRTNK